MAINEKQQPALFRLVTDRNLLRQYDFLQDRVNVALQTKDPTIDQVLLCQLNFQAVVMLSDTAGQYRTGPVNITNSKHVPPPASELLQLMPEMLDYLKKNWIGASASHLAAYALWRLCWIHPFEEGNGRTARATCLLIFCLKYGMWLPGKEIIPKQIRDNRPPYYAVLHEADEHYEKSGRSSIDVSATENYLNDLLTKQLAS